MKRQTSNITAILYSKEVIIAAVTPLFGCITILSGCGSTVTASRAACAGNLPRSITCKRKVIAFHHWDKGGPADDVAVVANFLHVSQEGHDVGFPVAGIWKLRFNSYGQVYSDDFSGYPSTDVVAEPGEHDGFPFHAALSIGPYSVLIYSQ